MDETKMTNSMLAQVYSLPEMIRSSFQAIDESVRAAVTAPLALSIKRLYLTGCGDSHHATLATEMAFESLAGLPVEPMTALQFARYGADAIPGMPAPGMAAVVGISVSGEVARTVEAMLKGKAAGLSVLALTATPGSRVTRAADLTVFSTVGEFPDPPDTHTPGVRSYAASQLALFLMAIRLGELRGMLANEDAAGLRARLLRLAEDASQTIEACDPVAVDLSERWKDAEEFVFVGGGPNYATALFSAAKVLEASGDPALGQDTEEWAHLQYFARNPVTPTFMITAGERDYSRMVEVAAAAKAIGRRAAAVCPRSSQALVGSVEAVLPLSEGLPEMFSPVIAAIPGELFAAHRAETIGEPFFRNFGGGREVTGGGGISRIRTSDLLDGLE